jgi:hypothetical protein
MKLSMAERLLRGQIVNVKLNTATLKDHIMLESIFKDADPDSIEYPIPQNFVPDDKQELFQKYENKQIKDIEDEEDKKVLQQAMIESREAEAKIWENKESEDEQVNVKFSPDQLKVLNDFYETDKRPFPRQYHDAIVSLHDKIESKKKKK